MQTPIWPDQELYFQLYQHLDTQALLTRPRFSEHNQETFNAVLETANRIATDKFADHNNAADADEPTFDGERVSIRAEVKVAFDAFAAAGFIAGRYDFEDGGMQLPETIMTAAAGFFTAANPSTAGYPFLTTAAANVIKHFATDGVRDAYLPAMLEGRFTGTMALTEPHAGSSLADIRSTATPAEDGSYRLKGSKLYISGGEHELSENIVHLVLAKIPGGPAGVKGISLFVVPKFRLNSSGNPAARNDVTLAGLIHKLGYRGTTSTALTFGEKDDCHGYLVGEPHQGLKYMFMMMNEARLGVGFGAAMIGYRGYQYSLAYAKDRLQGRSADKPGPEAPQVPIIEHGDVKRMLLAQKAYTEGAMALCLYGARLVDDSRTLEDESDRQKAYQLLDLLTPVIKGWSSDYGVKANDLAIQVLGGAGYTREYPVEQCWRDNRLNPIHEGTNGIQALDLLGRKLWQANGAGLDELQRRLGKDLATATGPKSSLLAAKLASYLPQFQQLLPALGQTLQGPQQGNLLANAQAVMNIFSALVIGWIWVRQAVVAEAGLDDVDVSQESADFYRGKLQAAQYFMQWELPLIGRDIDLLNAGDDTCATMQGDWF